MTKEEWLDLSPGDIVEFRGDPPDLMSNPHYLKSHYQIMYPVNRGYEKLSIDDIEDFYSWAGIKLYTIGEQITPHIMDHDHMHWSILFYGKESLDKQQEYSKISRFNRIE